MNPAASLYQLDGSELCMQQLATVCCTWWSWQSFWKCSEYI